MLPEKVVEVGRLFKTQRVTDFGDTPIRMFEQRLCFADQPCGNQGRCGLTGCFLYGAVQMVDMHVELVCEILRRAHRKSLIGRIDRELPSSSSEKIEVILALALTWW